MKSFLLAGSLLLLSVAVFSQIPADSTIPLEYFNKHWYKVAGREAAAYIRAYMGYDSAARLHEIRDYNANGRLLNTWHYNAEDRYVREGLSTWYWVNNRPSRSGAYVKGKRSGQWTDYYRNGQAQRQYSYPADPDSTADNDNYVIDNSWDSTGKAEVRKGNGIYRERNDSSGAVIQQGMVRNGLREGIWEGFDKNGQKVYEDEYTQGKFVKGTRFEENGACIPYDSLFISASFPGGTNVMMRTIYRTIRYPAEALDMGTEGTVIIGFTVDKTGDVVNVEVVRSVSEPIDREAMRVVSRMPPWIPGLQRGKPVAVAYRLPIKFALTEKKTKK
jgi:TonB family protein